MSRTISCPACAAPVTARAVMCALCDHVIDAPRMAAATRAADRQSSHSSRAAGGWRDMLRPVGGLLAAIAVLWLVTVLSFGIIASRTERAAAAKWGPLSTSHIATLHDAWPAIEATARRAALPVRQGPADRAAFRELLAGAISVRVSKAGERSRFAQLDADTTALARYGTPELAKLARGSIPIQLVEQSAPARLPDSLRLRFAADTLTPWLGVWRRAARGGEPTAAWHLQVGAPGVEGPAQAPMIGFAVYKALGWANAEAALLALDRGRRGDAAIAVARARENVAMAHVLMRTPGMLEFLMGRALLRQSAQLLAHVGRLANDSVALADGEALQQAIEPALVVRFFPIPRSADADVAVREAVATAGDTRLPPAVRTYAVQEIMTSSCLDAGDVILGPRDMRHAAVQQAAASLADIDPENRVRPVVARTDAEWDALVRGGWRRSAQDAPVLLDVAESVGMRGLAGRVMTCGMF